MVDIFANTEEFISEEDTALQSLERNAPVKPLGTLNGVYYFMSKLGEIRRLRAHEMNEAGLQSLFDGDLKWLQGSFPITPHQGRAKTGCEFNVPAARSSLMQLCSRKGIFDDTTPIRHIGVWKPKSGTMPIVHCGHEVLMDEAWHKAGFEASGCLYPSFPSTRKPAKREATTQEGRKMLEIFRRWNFEHPEGPEIALGLLGQAYIAGALPWKSHAMFYGAHGSGKTTLASLVSAALGPMAHLVTNNYTEAGLRQAMSNQSRAMLLDEMEHDSGARIRSVIKMIRQMSSGEGAVIKRGSPGGASQSFFLNGAVMMFCISPTHMEPQDRARVTRLKLLPLDTNSTQSPSIEACIEFAENLSLHLWRRSINRFEHFKKAFYVFKESLRTQGLTNRAGDQIATILAGADILLFDHPPEDADSIEERIRLIQPLINEWIIDEEENEGQLCLNKLYSSPVHPHARDVTTIGRTILEARETDGKFARETLAQIGLLIKDYHRKEPYLLVANNHEALSRLYGNSKWEKGGWMTALRYLPGTHASKNAVRFAGTLIRATVIPACYLPQKQEE